MTLRIWQPGRYDVRDLVLGYYVGEQLRQTLRDELGPDPIIAVDTAQPTSRYTRVGPGGIRGLAESKAWAEKECGCRVGRILVVGFSAGCQAPRALLLAGDDPDGIVAIDGVHSSKPPAAWQIDTWRKYADRARKGERLFAATCTQIDPYQYRGTRATLEDVVGRELPAADRFRDGLFFVESHPGTDKEAHIQQARAVLPRLVKQTAAALFETPTVPPSGPAPALRPWEDGSLPLGVRAALWSVNELQRGVRELTGRNDGPEIAAYFKGAIRDVKGTPDDYSDDVRTGHLDGWEWCAASGSCAAYAVHRPEDPPVPHGWRITAWETIFDLRHLGLFHDVESDYEPQVGDLVFFRRAGEDPRIPGQRGHEARMLVGRDSNDLYRSIDGNAGTAWAIKTRSVHDPDLVGWGAYPRPPVAAISPAERARAGQLLELSKAVERGEAPADALRRILA